MVRVLTPNQDIADIAYLKAAMLTSMTTSSLAPFHAPPPNSHPKEISPDASTPTAIVHLNYDIECPPEVPSNQWTRFVCISDTHGHVFAVPPGDVLLHSGDLTNTGRLSDFQRTIEWLSGLPHPTKIIIAGNHDLTLDQHDDWYGKNYGQWHRSTPEDVTAIRQLLVGDNATKTGIKYLQDELLEFQAKPDGRMWTVFGSPWSPTFGDWAFNCDRGPAAERLYASLPKTDILMTHGPPKGVFDTVSSGESVGCETLTAKLPALRPRLHIFGHIHEDHGAAVHDWSTPTGVAGPSISTDRTVFVNAANYPAGSLARNPDGRRNFAPGTGAFQPVIVDLLDRV